MTPCETHLTITCLCQHVHPRVASGQPMMTCLWCLKARSTVLPVGRWHFASWLSVKTAVAASIRYLCRRETPNGRSPNNCSVRARNYELLCVSLRFPERSYSRWPAARSFVMATRACLFPSSCKSATTFLVEPMLPMLSCSSSSGPTSNTVLV